MWRNVGSKMPDDGIKLINQDMSALLAYNLKYKNGYLYIDETFGINDLRTNTYIYIESANTYVKPVGFVLNTNSLEVKFNLPMDKKKWEWEVKKMFFDGVNEFYVKFFDGTVKQYQIIRNPLYGLRDYFVSPATLPDFTRIDSYFMVLYYSTNPRLVCMLSPHPH